MAHLRRRDVRLLRHVRHLLERASSARSDGKTDVAEDLIARLTENRNHLASLNLRLRSFEAHDSKRTLGSRSRCVARRDAIHRHCRRHRGKAGRADLMEWSGVDPLLVIMRTRRALTAIAVSDALLQKQRDLMRRTHNLIESSRSLLAGSGVDRSE
jgi:hypothetical protein